MIFDIGHKKMTIMVKTKIRHGHNASVAESLRISGHLPRYAKWSSRTIAYLDRDDPKFAKIMEILKETS